MDKIQEIIKESREALKESGEVKESIMANISPNTLSWLADEIKIALDKVFDDEERYLDLLKSRVLELAGHLDILPYGNER